jgi:hypothetical protein
MIPRSRGRKSPRSVSSLALSEWRAQGRPGARCTRGLVCSCAQKDAHTSIQVQREHPGLPCAVALRLIASSPRRTALLPPSPPRSLLLENLTPAPRRQDHTTSPYASCALVYCAIRVHRIPPRVRDDRDPPLVTGETGGFVPLICPTSPARICPSGCFVAASIIALTTSRRHSGARLGANPESIWRQCGLRNGFPARCFASPRNDGIKSPLQPGSRCFGRLKASW